MTMARRSPEEIAKIDRACRLVRQVLQQIAAMVAPGVSTGALDAHAEAVTRDRGAKPAFKGYMGYPASLCVSVNEEVVHGIPGPRVLREGDLVSLDFGALVDGYYGDSAITVAVGQVRPEDERLSRITRESLLKAVQEVRPGNHLEDIGHAVETHARAAGFGVVKEFVGHGIGTRLHEEPQVPNFGRPGRGAAIHEGLVLAIEPMITAGSPEVKVLEDGWTAVTRDGSRAAHWELVVAATAEGPRVLGDEPQLACER